MRSGIDCLRNAWKEYFAQYGVACAAIEGDDRSEHVLRQYNAAGAKQFQPIRRKTGTRLAPANPRKQKSQQALTC